ncbi:sporulation-control protein [Nocardia puris]|uniref:Sporulation-control protein n=1 Tax=Nocardia puris TaxID=208602 RepID=A0A366DJI5_9NOCA|nr:sporulation-control protein [Nocardia puris]
MPSKPSTPRPPARPTWFESIVDDASGGVADDDVCFGSNVVHGPLHLDGGDTQELRFTAGVPFETPITHHYGGPLPAISVALRAVAAIPSAADANVTVPLVVAATPAQDAVLEAVGRLGFPLLGTSVRAGSDLGGLTPAIQQIRFGGSPQFPGADLLSLSLQPGFDVTNAYVVIGSEGALTSPRSRPGHLRVDHNRIHGVDSARELHHLISGLSR